MLGKKPYTEEKKSTPSKDKRIVKLLFILVVLLGVQIVWSFLANPIMSLFLRTEVLESSLLNYSFSGEGLLGFEEKVIHVQGSGELAWLKEEGQRVIVGEEVAQVTSPYGRVTSIITPVPGLFSPHIDGLEDAVYPYLEWEPAREAFLSLKPLPQSYEAGDEVIGGSPLFKVINTFTWYFSLIVTEEEKNLVEENRRIHLDFVFADTTVPVTSYKVHDMEEGSFLLTFSLSRDVGDFYKRRLEEGTVIYKQEEGVFVPSSALLSKDGQTGVYRLVRSSVGFEELEVLRELTEDSRVFVQGLQPGWEIITNPRFFREGQRF